MGRGGLTGEEGEEVIEIREEKELEAGEMRGDVRQ